MLDAAVKAAKLETQLDAVLSVEEVGVYKPHPKVYQLAVDRLGIPASAISFQSSNAWDAYAASAFGIQVVVQPLRPTPRTSAGISRSGNPISTTGYSQHLSEQRESMIGHRGISYAHAEAGHSLFSFGWCPISIRLRCHCGGDHSQPD